MPYANVSELPDAVKNKLSPKRQRQWLRVWNSAYSHCTDSGGEAKSCETKAFKMAWGVAGKAAGMAVDAIEKMIAEGLEKGDVPGHEFHGNQYTGEGGVTAKEEQAKAEVQSKKANELTEDARDADFVVARHPGHDPSLERAYDAHEKARDAHLEARATYNRLGNTSKANEHDQKVRFHSEAMTNQYREYAKVSSIKLKTEEGQTMANTTEKSAAEGKVFLTLPISKIDEEQRVIEGIATAEVLDTQGDIVDIAHAVAVAFPRWKGNIREMHDPKKAVGSALSWEPTQVLVNDQPVPAVKVAARISKGAQDTWEKIKDKTLKYISIGIPAETFDESGKVIPGYERKPETMKAANADGTDRTVNRLFANTFGELSLVDVGSCPLATIGLVKADGVTTEVVASEVTAPAEEKAPAVSVVEKVTEDATDYADPGYQEDGEKRYPLDTEDHVKAAGSYFAMPRNRKKYTPEQQKKIDAKIRAAKKRLKIGEFADKAERWFEIQKQDGTALPWVPMHEPDEGAEMPQWPAYVPRTFGGVWEDVEDASVFPMMVQALSQVILNVLVNQTLDGSKQQAMIQQSFDEFMEELKDEFMEATEEATEPVEAAAAQAEVEKVGARNSKADLEKIQGIHDHSVILGAICKKSEPEPTDEEKTIAAILQKVQLVSVGLDEVTGKLKAVRIEPLEVHVAESTIDVAKIAEALSASITKVLETRIETSSNELKTALTAEVTKATEITSKLQGDLVKTGAAVEGVAERLTALERKPATATLPVSRPAPGMQGTEVAKGGDASEIIDVEIAVLEKQVRDNPRDPDFQRKLNTQIGLLKIKKLQPQQR